MTRHDLFKRFVGCGRDRRVVRRWPIAASAMVLALVAPSACDDSLLVAPTGATITLSTNPTTIAIDGDSAVVAATVLTSESEPVDNGTQVIFTTTLGALCDSTGASCTASAAPTLSSVTRSGIARVLMRTGATPGAATITARSGKATGTATLTISGLVAPADASLRLSAAPPTIETASGSSRIDVFVATNGTPVPDNTRLLFTATAGVVSPAIALTRNGFAKAELRGVPNVGVVYVRVASGAISDSVAVMAK